MQQHVIKMKIKMGATMRTPHQRKGAQRTLHQWSDHCRVASANVVGLLENRQQVSLLLNGCDSWERTNTGIIIYSQQTLTHMPLLIRSIVNTPVVVGPAKKSGKWQQDKLELRA